MTIPDMTNAASWLTTGSNFLMVAGAALGLFLGFFFLRTETGDKRNNRVLALLLFLTAVIQAHTLLLPNLSGPDGGNNAAIPRIFPDPYLFLLGPVVWYCFRVLTRPPRHTVLGLLHIAPFVGVFAFAVLRNEAAFGETSAWGLPLAVAFWAALAAQWSVYLALSRRELVRAEADLKRSFSSQRQVSLSNLRFILHLFFVLLLALALCPVILLHTVEAGLASRLINALLAILVFVVGFASLKTLERIGRLQAGTEHPASVIAVAANAAEPAAEKVATASEKYRRSGMTSEEAKSHYPSLKDFVAKKRSYLDPELSLNGLADATGYAPYQLSQILNEGGEASFYEFINRFRVDETIRLLRSPEQAGRSLLELALDAGFASKATFNRVFKSAVGLTPGQFRAANPP